MTRGLAVVGAALVAVALVTGCPGSSDAVVLLDAATPDVASEPVADASIDARPDAAVADADAGLVDAAPRVCTGDLSGIGTGDFRISFTLTTTQFGTVAIANQRPTCTHGVMWDVHLVGGMPVIETDDHTNYTVLNSTAVVNDGLPHEIVFGRSAGLLVILVDGAITAADSSLAAFGALSSLRVGMGPCDGIGSTVPFSGITGTIANLCVGLP